MSTTGKGHWPEGHFAGHWADGHWPAEFVVAVAGLIRKAFFTLFVAKKKEFNLEL